MTLSQKHILGLWFWCIAEVIVILGSIPLMGMGITDKNTLIVISTVFFFMCILFPIVTYLIPQQIKYYADLVFPTSTETKDATNV